MNKTNSLNRQVAHSCVHLIPEILLTVINQMFVHKVSFLPVMKGVFSN